MKKHKWIPWLVIAVMAFAYNYHQTLFKGPMSRHQWRQSDALSMTLNYAEGTSLFEPQIHYQDVGEGHGVGELPIIYYFNAQMWQVVGENPFTPRLLTFIFMLLGLWALHKIAYRFTQDAFWSWMLPWTLFCAPLFVFYGNNFLVNIPALSLVFLSWHWVISFYDTNKKKYLWLGVVAITMAGLLRMTMLLGWIPFGVIWLEVLWKGKKVQHGIPTRAFWLLTFIPIMVCGIWFFIVKYYNENYHSQYFLTTIRPLWKVENLEQHFKSFLYFIWGEFHLSGFRWLFPVILVFLLTRINVLKNRWGVSLLLVAVASIFYLVLWANNLDVHDYYMLEMYILYAMILLAVLYAIQEWRPSLFYSKTLRIIAAAGLVWMIYQTAAWQRVKYDPADRFAQHAMVIDKEHMERWEYEKWAQDTQIAPFKVMREGKSEWGLNRNAVVVVPQDPSPNITLYMMDLKGYTGMYYTDIPWSERLKMYHDRGAEYLLIRDEANIETLGIDPSQIFKIGQREQISIYRILP
ncbi:MAG: hypothetical protein R2809_12955 [Flavobacteriales bacterium]